MRGHGPLNLPIVTTFMNPVGRMVITAVAAAIDHRGTATFQMTTQHSGVPVQTHVTNAPAVRELLSWLASAQKTIESAIDQGRDGYMKRVREDVLRSAPKPQPPANLIGEGWRIPNSAIHFEATYHA